MHRVFIVHNSLRETYIQPSHAQRRTCSMQFAIGAAWCGDGRGSQLRSAITLRGVHAALLILKS